jgi:hypothetical protein
MKKLILLLVLPASIQAQGMINIQSGSGTPTDMVVGGLLGALIAPMISKGSDAKLVGGLLGAMAGGAYGTAQAQQGQMVDTKMQQQQMAYQQQMMQQQMAYQQQMASMNTSSGMDYKTQPKLGIKKGKMVQSPYSRFSFDPSSMNMDSGEVIFDPICGKPIKIP